MSEILDKLINDNLRDVLIEKKIRPSVQPTVDVKNIFLEAEINPL